MGTNLKHSSFSLVVRKVITAIVFAFALLGAVILIEMVRAHFNERSVLVTNIIGFSIYVGIGATTLWLRRRRRKRNE